MKKLLLAFAILGFVACNNEGDTKESATDTVTAPAAVDTAAPAVADTTVKVDTAAAAAADTTKK